MARPEPTWTPPLRVGVSASRVAVGSDAPGNVGAFLEARFPAVADWSERLARGDVLNAQGQPLTAQSSCSQGQLIWYWRQPPPEPRVPFEVELLYQDELLVVVDKPHFLAVTPGGRHLHETVLVRLRDQLAIDTLAPLHRLDRDTAGVLVFTVQPRMRPAYHALLRERQVHKVYEAIAPWHAGLAVPATARHRLVKPAGPGFMQVQVEDGPPNAETDIDLIGRLQGTGEQPGPSSPRPLAHYRLIPHTGHTHQLRAQMAALGMPIAGDRVYPQLQPESALGTLPDYSQPLQLLSRSFSFTDPINGKPRWFTSARRLLLGTGHGGPTDAKAVERCHQQDTDTTVEDGYIRRETD